MKLPDEYLRNMKDLLKDEFDDYLSCFDHASVNGLRINTSKISVNEFLKIAPFVLKQVSWCENGFYYDSEESPSHHPYYNAGLYYLQEPSAMAPGAFFSLR